MKEKKIILLPLLSAAFLLSGCQGGEEISSLSLEESSESSSSQESETPIDPFWGDEGDVIIPDVAENADSGLSILKKALKTPAESHGFKTTTNPAKFALTGMKFANDEEGNKTSIDWDVLLTVQSINAAMTHLGDGNQKEDYNFSFQIQDADVDKIQYGLGPLFGTRAKAINRLINSFASDMYANLYYAGNAYPDRIYYDFDDEEGDESNAAFLFLGMRSYVCQLLDQMGYSVYPNDDPELDPTFDYVSKGYLTIPEEEKAGEEENPAPFDNLATEWGKIVDEYLFPGIEDYIPVLVSSKKDDIYTLSASFDEDQSFFAALSSPLNNLEEDWQHTIKIPYTTKDEEGKEITKDLELTITKKQIQDLVASLDEALNINRFSLRLDYNEAGLIGSSFKLDLDISQSIFEEDFDSKIASYEPDSGEEEPEVIGVSNVKINLGADYSLYQKVAEDDDEAILKEHLWEFANLPSKEALNDPKIYPEQPLPPKKQDKGEDETSGN